MNADAGAGHEACAPSDMRTAVALWRAIDWQRAYAHVKKLQTRIAKAQRAGRRGRVKSLQWLLTHSLYARLVAVMKAGRRGDGNISGADGGLWRDESAKASAALSLSRRNYHPMPLRPVRTGRRTISAIPEMTDRAMQTLWLMALEPVLSAYGMVPSDKAAAMCVLMLKQRPEMAYVIKCRTAYSDITRSRAWLRKNVPADGRLAGKFMDRSYWDKPDRSVSAIRGMTGIDMREALNGVFMAGIAGNKSLADADSEAFVYRNIVIVAGISYSAAEKTLLRIEKCLTGRGLCLRRDGMVKANIGAGFEFNGCNIRRYAGGGTFALPSRADVKDMLGRVRGIIKHNRSASQTALIMQLNPLITGWALAHRYDNACRAFERVDNKIFRSVVSWAARRHAHKSSKWIMKRYFHTCGRRKHVFSALCSETQDMLKLARASDVHITRCKTPPDTLRRPRF